jgi:hypothetical protein
VVQTQVRFLKSTNESDAIAIFGRSPDGSGEAYAAGINAAGEIELRRSYPKGDDDVFARAATSLDPFNEDVAMELRFLDNQIDFFAWSASSDKPKSPQLMIDDSELHSGWPGISVDVKNGVAEAIFRDYRVIPIEKGDFDYNGLFDAADIDALAESIHSEGADRIFDLTGDGSLTLAS